MADSTASATNYAMAIAYATMTMAMAYAMDGTVTWSGQVSDLQVGRSNL